jgi:hypothetical protein
MIFLGEEEEKEFCILDSENKIIGELVNGECKIA